MPLYQMRSGVNEIKPNLVFSLPPKQIQRKIMDRTEPLFGTPCPCCKGPRQLVRSRSGGLVTQNCLNFGHCDQCKRPGKLLLEQLPKRHCEKCRARLVPLILQKTYWYKCEACQTFIKLASIVPHWSELFPDCGLGLESDQNYQVLGCEIPEGMKVEYLPPSQKI